MEKMTTAMQSLMTKHISRVKEFCMRTSKFEQDKKGRSRTKQGRSRTKRGGAGCTVDETRQKCPADVTASTLCRSFPAADRGHMGGLEDRDGDGRRGNGEGGRWDGEGGREATLEDGEGGRGELGFGVEGRRSVPRGEGGREDRDDRGREGEVERPEDGRGSGKPSSSVLVVIFYKI